MTLLHASSQVYWLRYIWRKVAVVSKIVLKIQTFAGMQHHAPDAPEAQVARIINASAHLMTSA